MPPEDQEPELPKGVTRRRTAGGGTYLFVHYGADPTKDADWVATESAKVGGEKGVNSREWRREMEGDENVYPGEPVWEDYNEAVHCPVGWQDQRVPLFEDSFFVGGWDAGPTLQPAFALAQITKPGQILWTFEVVPDRPMPMKVFCPIVAAALKARLPGQWADVIHVGDATGVNRSQSDGMSAFEVAAEHGFQIMPITNDLHIREAAVVWMLRDWLDQSGDRSEWTPRTLYGAMDCPILVQGMRGAYCLDVQGKGGAMEVKKAKKNSWSHVNDGHQYAAVEIKRILESGAFRVQSRYGGGR